MQSTDENGKVVQARMLEEIRQTDNKKPRRRSPAEERVNHLSDQIADALKTAKEKGAVKHVIANLPNQGQDVEINGLKFTVSYVNNRRGDVHLKLVGIEETADEPVTDEASEAV